MGGTKKGFGNRVKRENKTLEAREYSGGTKPSRCWNKGVEEEKKIQA